MSTNRMTRVLVVDDSAYMRKALREMLESSPQIEVVDTARDGIDALEKVDAYSPDVVTVDLVMPGMSGAQLIKKLVDTKSLPVVVCSSTEVDSQEMLAAMEAGAVEYVAKPTALALEKVYIIQQRLVEAVRAAAAVSREKLGSLAESLSAPVLLFPGPGARTGVVEAVVIGISTGGPRALRGMIPRFPASLPVPVVIALHMPPGYTNLLAEQLNASSQVEVVESSDITECLPGRVILAQAGVHTRISRHSDGRVFTSVSPDPGDTLYCPSVDVLFESAAETYRERLLAVVMTGMGSDGTRGAGWVKSHGGQVFVEAEESCVVYGMPRSVYEAGLADRVVQLERMPDVIMEALQ